MYVYLRKSRIKVYFKYFSFLSTSRLSHFVLQFVSLTGNLCNNDHRSLEAQQPKVICRFNVFVPSFVRARNFLTTSACFLLCYAYPCFLLVV